MAQGRGGKGRRSGAAAAPAGKGSNTVFAVAIAGVIALVLGIALYVASGASGPEAPDGPAPTEVATVEAVAKAPKPAPAAPTPVAAPGPSKDDLLSELESKYEGVPVTPTAPSDGSVSVASSVPVVGATERVKVVRCIDGDTVVLADDRRVRLVGINTPERDTKLYAEATDALRELVEGREVTLEYDQERQDQFKRTLGYLHRDGMFVNGEIVRRGLAYCYTWKPNTAHSQDLVKLQRVAREAEAGLWGLPKPPPAERYVGSKTGHRFHREGCKRMSRTSQAKRIEWATRDEAFDVGQNPCSDCNP